MKQLQQKCCKQKTILIKSCFCMILWLFVRLNFAIWSRSWGGDWWQWQWVLLLLRPSVVEAGGATCMVMVTPRQWLTTVANGCQSTDCPETGHITATVLPDSGLHGQLQYYFDDPLLHYFRFCHNVTNSFMISLSIQTLLGILVFFIFYG